MARLAFVQNKRIVRFDPVFKRRYLRWRRGLAQRRGIVAAVGKADGGTASQIFTASLLHQCEQSRPQHHQHAASTVVRLNTCAGGLHGLVAHMHKQAQVEPAVGLNPPTARCRARCRHPLGSDDFERLRVAHDQTIAMRIEFVLIQSIQVRL